MDEVFALRHAVTFSKGGVFAQLMGAEEVMTNTLHGQGIDRAGPRVVIDGYAPDGTPEAIYIRDAPGFTLSVQWHPEWNAAHFPKNSAAVMTGASGMKKGGALPPFQLRALRLSLPGTRRLPRATCRPQPVRRVSQQGPQPRGLPGQPDHL